MSRLSIPLALFTVVAAGGCQSPSVGTTEAALQAAAVPTETAEDKYGLGWIKADDGSDGGPVIRANIVIDAPVDVVWSLVRNPNGYANFNQALTAHVDKMEIGQPISLDIRLFGDNLPPTNSLEKIAIFDETLHVASWDRDFGLDQVTHRPQLLEAEGTGTHYYTALRLPKAFGWLVQATLGCNIQSAFARFATGLRDESLRIK
jgi:hypothetical protein